MENESRITVQKAESRDLKNIFELDEKVSFEFFEPLYKKHYAHTSLGKNPKLYLNSELEIDRQEFPKIINDPDYYFLVAKQKDNDNCTGFLIAHKISDFYQIDLLLVDEQFRGFGIGSKLISALKDKNLCTYVMKENKSAINFYKKSGFEITDNPNPDKLNSYGIKYKDMYFYMIKPS